MLGWFNTGDSSVPSGGPLCTCPWADHVSPPLPLRWAFLELHTNGHYNDSLQAYAAGVVEAAVTEEVRPDGDTGAPASPTPHQPVPRELRTAPRSVQSGLPAPALRLAGERGSRAFLKRFHEVPLNAYKKHITYSKL